MSSKNKIQHSTATDTLNCPKTEYYNESGETLPDTEPASGQISYTIAASDFANINEIVDTNAMPTIGFFFICGGKNLSDSTLTLSYRILKNGTSLTTGTLSLYASRYWTITFHGITGVVVGDVFEIRLWGSTSLDWRYKSITSVPLSYNPGGKPGRLITNIYYYLPYSYIGMAGTSTPVGQTGSSLYFEIDNDGGANTEHSITSITYLKMNAWVTKNNKGMLYSSAPTTITVYTYTSTTYMPSYYKPPKLFDYVRYSPTNIFL